MRLLLQEEVVVQENVEMFDTSVLEDLLGGVYHVDIALLSPVDFGFPIARPRKYTVCRHKFKTKAWKSPFNIFSGMFQADMLFGKFEVTDPVPAWHVYFCAEPADLLAELQWACSRQQSGSYESGCPFKTVEDLKEALERRPSDVKEAFLNALNPMETLHLHEYRSRCPQRAYSLNQNPEVSMTTSGWDRLQCLIKNTGLLWSDFHGRWLAANEALLCQGIPVYAHLSLGVAVSPFAVRHEAGSDELQRRARIGQAGNAMHSMMCAVPLVYAMTQIESVSQGYTSQFAGLMRRLRADTVGRV